MYAQKSSGGGGFLKVLLVGCFLLFVVIICCIILSVGLVTFALGEAITAVKDSVVDVTCNVSSAEAFDAYYDDTTENFKAEITFTEFESMLDEIDDDVCDEIEGISGLKALTKGWNINYSTEDGVDQLEFDATINDKDIEIDMIEEDGSLKLDFLSVD